MLLHNARVLSMDPACSQARAVLLRGGTIVEVYQRDGDISRGLRRGVETLDCGDGLLLPGFHDAHVHLLSGGLVIEGVDLCGVRTGEDFRLRVETACRFLGAGEWLIGAGWDPPLWTGGAVTRALLDAWTMDRPCLLYQADLHAGIANSRALESAGVTASTPDPAGGVIERDAVSGEPTGMLREAALRLVDRRLQRPSMARRRRAARAAIRRCAELGVTTVHEICSIDDAVLYQAMAEEQALPARLRLLLFEPDWHDRLDEFAGVRCDTPWVKANTLKAFVDGALGSRTALMDEPYLDEPNNVGQYDPMAMDWTRFNTTALAADRRGWQLALHAIGTRANREALDLAARLARENGPRDRRMRIEHAQHLLPGDPERFAALGVVASVQPVHAIDDGRWALKALGAERCRWSYPFRSLAAAGVCLAFGSDWPVASMSPLDGVRAAVMRRLVDGEVWQPQECVSVGEALAAYTRGAAWACFEEAESGAIRRGARADLVLLSHDIERYPETLNEARVVMTILDGTVIHDARETRR